MSELASRFDCQLRSLTPLLASMNLNAVINPDSECNSCRNIDFSKTNNDLILTNGKEISQEWKAIGLSIDATSFAVTNQESLKVRIFDTSNSTCIQTTNTLEFGSPNNLCPGGGPGLGNGGAPGSDGENCISVGSK
jgi:hypothetical protein